MSAGPKQVARVWTRMRRRRGAPRRKLFYSEKYLDGHTVRLLKTGDEVFPALEEMILSAEQHVHIECYIYRDDEIGKRIGEALKTVARKGIPVHLLLDSLGSLGLSAKFIKDLKDAGVEVHFFHPLLKALYKFKMPHFRQRLHRKIFIVDGYKAIVGGINISSNYATINGKQAWLDYAVLLNGPVVFQIAKICERFWDRIAGNRFFYKTREWKTGADTVLVAMVRNFSLLGLYDIYYSYLRAIRRAQKSIILANAYFLPGIRERLELKRAVKRGARVRLIVPHVSDVFLMKWAMRHLYRQLFRYGIEIYEWQPSMMHAKVAVIDGVWSTVGSHNMDTVSKFYNLELNVNVLDREFAEELSRSLEKSIEEGCVRIIPSKWKRRGRIVRVFEWSAYQVVLLFSSLGGKVIRRASNRLSRSF